MRLEKRIKNIFKKMEIYLDAIIVKNSTEPIIDNNFFYVTGLNKGLFEGSAAIIYPDGKLDLLVSELESESAKNIAGGLCVYRNNEEFNDSLETLVGSLKNVGLNFSSITYQDFIKFKNMFKGLDFVDVSSIFSKARQIKDSFEIHNIKKACNIADNAMNEIPNILKKDMSENELAAEIDYLMQKNGATKAAFETISSFGKNAAEPHYSHGDIKLKNGDIVLCDFGAQFKKYNSDITRTFIFGKASEKIKKMHQTVLNAQKIAFNKAKAGVKACEIHEAVSTYINKTNFKGRFIHNTGHALGLDVHDPGVGLSANCNAELEENMILTIEPGVYIPGFGGVRIEDDVLIKKNGIEILTKSNRELIEIF